MQVRLGKGFQRHRPKRSKDNQDHKDNKDNEDQTKEEVKEKEMEENRINQNASTLRKVRGADSGRHTDFTILLSRRSPVAVLFVVLQSIGVMDVRGLELIRQRMALKERKGRKEMEERKRKT